MVRVLKKYYNDNYKNTGKHYYKNRSSNNLLTYLTGLFDRFIPDYLRNILVYSYNSIDFDLPHVTGLLRSSHGVTQYRNTLFRNSTLQNQNRNIMGRGQGYGLFGGTLTTYNNIRTVFDRSFVDGIVDNIRNTQNPGVPMLNSDTDLWSWFRTQYSLNSIHSTTTTDRTIPALTHVDLSHGEGRPNNTGIMPHLLSENRTYGRMTADQFNLARQNLINLMQEYATSLGDRLDELNDAEPYEVDYTLSQYYKAVHEFLGLLHHYQMHFSNRTGPRDV